MNRTLLPDRMLQNGDFARNALAPEREDPITKIVGWDLVPSAKIWTNPEVSGRLSSLNGLHFFEGSPPPLWRSSSIKLNLPSMKLVTIPPFKRPLSSYSPMANQVPSPGGPKRPAK